MTGYDAATVEACAKVVDALAKYGTAKHDRSIAARIRALPIAPPAPLQVAVDDVALIDALEALKPCQYCQHGQITGLPGNACENCMNTGLEGGGLTATMTRALPSGTFDDATYEQIEAALDAAEAPSIDKGRWLKLHERVAALARRATPSVDETELDRLRAEIKRLSTPSGYWNPDDREFGHDELEDLLCDEDGDDVHAVAPWRNLPLIYAAYIPVSEDDGEWQSFPTEAEARAALDREGNAG